MQRDHFSSSSASRGVRVWTKSISERSAGFALASSFSRRRVTVRLAISRIWICNRRKRRWAATDATWRGRAGFVIEIEEKEKWQETSDNQWRGISGIVRAVTRLTRQDIKGSPSRSSMRTYICIYWSQKRRTRQPRNIYSRYPVRITFASWNVSSTSRERYIRFF